MPGPKSIGFVAAALVLALTGGVAAAQVFGPATGGQGFGPPTAGGFGPPPGQGFGPPPGQAEAGFGPPPSQPQGGMPPCAQDIVPLRQDVEKTGLAVKAAIDGKAERSEICNRLKRFTSSETKFIKYLETNAGWCGIPSAAIQQVKASHKHSSNLRDRACATGAAASPRIAPGPGLSEALGTNRPPPDTSKKGAGTFDTLTGNSLKQ